jgi:tRNA-specific 2-thiouridylase
MSGGVDSSVAACLLKEQGFNVVGVFMRLGSENITPAPVSETSAAPGQTAGGPASVEASQPSRAIERRPRGCCSVADATDARAVAAKFAIPFYVLNFQGDFARLIDYFVGEYAAARTPNPCILCNQWLKFGKLAEYADVIGAEMIATGHYARIAMADDRLVLQRAKYLAKDQSYVLFSVAPAILRRVRFPLGELTKDEVREHARRLGLALHDKPESQDICFVPDGDYARLVRTRKADAFVPGRIRHVDGRDLGGHDGLPNFTIGQRRGLRVALGEPVYVVDLEPESGTVVIGPKSALLCKTAAAANVNWLISPPVAPFRAEVQIRYSHSAAPAEVAPTPNGEVSVTFDNPQPAVTPGQAMVFYRGDQVLGGGWITRQRNA